MKKNLIIICFVFMVSLAVSATENINQTCANGAGRVIEGVITGHKYCKSNNYSSWYNAAAWCDALGRRLITMDDCACSVTVNCLGKCADLVGISDASWLWTAIPYDTSSMYATRFGSLSKNERRTSGLGYTYALCY